VSIPLGIANVLLICVNYHSDAEAAECVRSALRLLPGTALRCVVVDNSEHSAVHPELAALARSDPRIAVWSAPGNLGYFGGARWGLERAAEEAGQPDWVIVSNPDIRFSDPEALIKLAQWHGRCPPAVVAPSIVRLSTGLDENPFMRVRPSSSRMRFYRSVFSLYALTVAYSALGELKRLLQAWRHERPSFRDLNEPVCPAAIYAPHGSCIFFSRSYFQRGGSLAYGAFLFGEEVFVAETVRRLGLEVVYDPRLVVAHAAHVTTPFFRRPIARHHRDSSAYLVRAFFSQSQL
jgi:GT2 family glycosyltransferase